jgi:RNA methyltransferase, TrmH family
VQPQLPRPPVPPGPVPRRPESTAPALTALAYRNEEVQRLRRLVGRRDSRWEERSFVVEGAKIVAEALAAHAPVHAVYLDSRDATAADRDLAERCAQKGAKVVELQHGVLDRACDTFTPQPIAAVVGMVDVPLRSALASSPQLVVFCVDLQDPGNAGSLIRSVGAAGAGAVVFSQGSVDVFNPKAVRSSAGALFHVPVVAGHDTEEVLDELRRPGLRLMGTAALGGHDYATEDLTAPTAFVLGNEAHGLPAQVTSRLDGTLTIPIAPSTESLNVAVAAALLCFEAARQRRHPPR